MAKQTTNYKGKKKDKGDRKPRINNKIELGFYVSPDTPETIVDEIEEAFSITPFDKISFPITTYKSYLDKRIPEDDNRVSAVGYVKDYDIEKGLFTVVIFNSIAEIITKFEQPVLEVIFSSRDDKLGVITRLNIVPTEVDKVEPETTEVAETVEEDQDTAE